MMEEIIRKVLEELKALEKQESPKKKMMVLSEEADPCEKLHQRFGRDYELTYRSTFGKEEIPDAVVLKSLTPDVLVALSQGKNGPSGPVMECLMDGIPVYLCEEGLYHVKRRTTCSRPLYSLYDDCVKQLIAFGCKLIPVKEETAAQGFGKPLKRQLLTEGELKKRMAAGERTLVIQERTLITPLAKDLIKENGICVVMEKGGEDHADS